jgi:hypothetical protein
MIFYKIRQKQTGLFSNKGYEFKKIGSFWTTKNDLQHHLKMTPILVNDKFAKEYFSTIEIVKYEMQELENFDVEYFF